MRNRRARHGAANPDLERRLRRDFDAAFATLAPNRAPTRFPHPGHALFVRQHDRLAAMAARHAVPAMQALRDYVEAGGLISYGTNITDAFRQVGVYTGRISRASNLPICR